MKKFINVIDVTLRDGIQTERKLLTSHEKFIIINAYVDIEIIKLMKIIYMVIVRQTIVN